MKVVVALSGYAPLCATPSPASWVLAMLTIVTASYARTAEPIIRPLPPLAHAAPDPGEDEREFGTHLQRTMALLATSTSEHRNHVRILVYGQSISQGDWWKEVERDLRERFPNADLEMVNRALGGHASNYLVREAETDVYPFYPDLIIFHVYGAHTCYEQLIARIRSRTTAEMLITNDHLAAQEAREQGKFVDKDWTKWMAKWIPLVAGRYGCELVGVREAWKRYVLNNHLVPQDLLSDGIHLNPQGNALYAELIKRHLVYRPELKEGDVNATVRTYEVGRDIFWKDGKLTLECNGNRIDAIVANGGENQSASVSIDGRKPSDFRECYAFTRTSGIGHILCMFSERTPQVEDWTLRFTSVDPISQSATYKAIGTRTGTDGEGNSTQRFVSRSGRLVIENAVEKPQMAIESDFDHLHFADPALVPGAEITFSCYALHADRFVAPPADPGHERHVTLAQGLINGKHSIMLTAEGSGNVPLLALRVYSPPVAANVPMLYPVTKVEK